MSVLITLEVGLKCLMLYAQTTRKSLGLMCWAVGVDYGYDMMSHETSLKVALGYRTWRFFVKPYGGDW